MTDVQWRHRPRDVPMPVVPRERIYGDVAPIRPIRSRPQMIMDDVCHEHGVEISALIHHRSRIMDRLRMLAARKDAARRMHGIGLTTTQIGRFLHRNHTTILDYLGMRSSR